MAAEWRSCRVQVLMNDGVLVVGDGYRAKNIELEGEGLPFARAGNINSGFQFEGADLLGWAGVGRAGVKASLPGDVVFTSKGTVGRFAFVRSNTPKFVYSPQLCFWRSLAPEVLDPLFLYYWMNSKEFLQQVAAVSGQTDMAAYVSLRDQRKMMVTVPSLAVQRRIAAVLGALDHKIELNRKMNRMLEEMAQAIFTSWFIDFDGMPPEDPVDSELGPIPKGWEVKRLGELCSKFTDGSHWSPQAAPDPTGLRIATVKDMGDTSFHWSTMKHVTAGDHRRLGDNGCLASKGDILFSKDGTIGRVIYYLDDEVLGLLSSIAILRPRSEEVGLFLWAFLRQPTTVEIIKGGYVSGSALPRVILRDLRQLPLRFPSHESLCLFGQVVGPICHRIHLATQASRTLTALRDALLPKLISGEVRIPEAERQAEAML